MRIWKKIWIQKIMLWMMSLRERDGFWTFRASSKSMILNWDFNDASDFEMKFSTLFQILNFFQNVWESEKKFAVKKSRYESRYSMKTTYFAFLGLLRQARFKNPEIYVEPDFEKSYTIRHILNWTIETCKILKKSFWNVSKLEIKLLSENYVLNHDAPRKRRFCIFHASSKSSSLN